MRSKAPRPGSQATRDLARLVEAQAAGYATWAGLLAQWTGIATRFAERGAGHLATLAGERQRRFPDSYERAVAHLVSDYTQAVRQAAALPSTGVLRYARELRKLARDDD
jgi:hypothetical protein